MITTSDYGGTEAVLEQLAAGLDRRRFEPVVCSLCEPGRAARRLAAAGVAVESLGLAPAAKRARLARIGELAGASLRLARRIDALGIDLVHSMLYRANVLAALAGRLSRRRPVVVSGQHSLTPMAGRPAALAARLTRPLVDRVVAVSAAVARQVERDEGVDPRRLVVIANGVDTERFRPAGAAGRAAARAALRLPPGTVVAGTVGRHSPEKGLDDLLAAVALARGRGVPLELVLAGDGPQREGLERQAGELGIGGHVHFLGARPDPEAVYPALDVFVLPSLEEGSPVALLEAMACGCAVAASRVGGVPEVLAAPAPGGDADGTGLMVAPGDREGLADALARLAGDPGLRRRLGAAARRRIEAELGVAAMIERHERLYSSLLGAAGEPGA